MLLLKKEARMPLGRSSTILSSPWDYSGCVWSKLRGFCMIWLNFLSLRCHKVTFLAKSKYTTGIIRMRDQINETSSNENCIHFRIRII